MKTSRIIIYGYSKLMVFFLLFIMATLALAEPDASTEAFNTPVPTMTTAEQKEVVNTTASSGETSDAPLTHPPKAIPPAESPFNTHNRTKIKETPSLTFKQAHVETTPLVSHSEIKGLSATTDATVKSLSDIESTSAVQGTLVADTSSSHVIPSTHAHPTVGQKYSATPDEKIPSKATATISPTSLDTSWTELSQKPRQTEEETEVTNAPARNISDNIIITSATTPVMTDKDPKTDAAGANSSRKNHTIIILAVAFGVLCLLAIAVFLYRRRRHHSGSTSFNTAGWAGQVALPDDSGLDKDIEPGAAAASGEADSRRNTLVTFFGKRQSRVPSVAMEDISEKREREECQQLLDEDDGQGSGPEGAGEANGKLPESSKQSSGEASTE